MEEPSTNARLELQKKGRVPVLQFHRSFEDGTAAPVK